MLQFLSVRFISRTFCPVVLAQSYNILYCFIYRCFFELGRPVKLQQQPHLLKKFCISTIQKFLDYRLIKLFFCFQGQRSWLTSKVRCKSRTVYSKITRTSELESRNDYFETSQPLCTFAKHFTMLLITFSSTSESPACVLKGWVSNVWLRPKRLLHYNTVISPRIFRKPLKSHHICVSGESFSIILRSIFRTDVEEAGQTIFLSSVLSSLIVVSTPFSLERYHHGLS